MVTLLAAGVHATLLTVDHSVGFQTLLANERTTVIYTIMGDIVAGLVSMIVCLAIQLKQEEIHYKTAMERAAIVAELNHHVRNAIFPLCLIAQKIGNEDASRIANEAIDKINIALRDATADAMSGRADYSANNRAMPSLVAKRA
jgi:hypothetical protein